MRACAIKMQFHKSHLARKFAGKTSCPRLSQDADTHTHKLLCEPTEKCKPTIYKSRIIRKLAKKMPPRARTYTLREPAESNCTSRSRKRPCKHIFYRKNARPHIAAHPSRKPAQSKSQSTFHKNHFVLKFPKMPLSQECRHPLCASLRSRNANQHFTRVTLYRNLQEQCRAQD